ncbi:LysR family transcriptional regulator [Pandoraea iniqua]|uniref:LysR family transcriptional regulator n=1 Tax=Pandoraea iniqua TaxID=2508288 RepID=A0A5E4X6S1_9BURK|nr:LysR substrate-binding domain-containing protein [Pandoraea iniqua]VVE10822.1 LysR family transcriptional regulator [Pandoraea iniqua]VVE31976.1 LysR family transcriptional regulator [Pandoraea iniqua]
MPALRHCYPNVAELLAFASAARHLNFSRAARELGLTPSAVSRQIAALEALVATPLFVREGRNLTLTDAGRRYHERVAEPLREIGNASLELMTSRGESDLLTIASVPTFTTKWLIPRLPDFLEKTPGVTLSFSRHLSHGDAFPFSLDAAIRYGDGTWEGVVSDYLDGRSFVPVCAPSFLERYPLTDVADVARAPRLVHSQAEDVWGTWARCHDVGEQAQRTGPRFEQYSVLLQAAEAGMGVGMVPAFLAREALTAGRLVEPVDAGVDVPHHGHYLCYPRERLQQRTALQHFREWMLAQAGQSQR